MKEFYGTLQNSAGVAQLALLAHPGRVCWAGVDFGPGSMKRLRYLCVPVIGSLDGALLLGHSRRGSSASGFKSKLSIPFFLTPT